MSNSLMVKLRLVFDFIIGHVAMKTFLQRTQDKYLLPVLDMMWKYNIAVRFCVALEQLYS